MNGDVIICGIPKGPFKKYEYAPEGEELSQIDDWPSQPYPAKILYRVS